MPLKEQEQIVRVTFVCTLNTERFILLMQPSSYSRQSLASPTPSATGRPPSWWWLCFSTPTGVWLSDNNAEVRHTSSCRVWVRAIFGTISAVILSALVARTYTNNETVSTCAYCFYSSPLTGSARQIPWQVWMALSPSQGNVPVFLY